MHPGKQRVYAVYTGAQAKGESPELTDERSGWSAAIADAGCSSQKPERHQASISPRRERDFTGSQREDAETCLSLRLPSGAPGSWQCHSHGAWDGAWTSGKAPPGECPTRSPPAPPGPPCTTPAPAWRRRMSHEGLLPRGIARNRGGRSSRLRSTTSDGPSPSSLRRCATHGVTSRKLSVHQWDSVSQAKRRAACREQTWAESISL